MLFFYILTGIMLVHFQNCAQEMNQDSPVEVGSPVDVIDPINVGDISFPQSKVEAFSNQENVVLGICEQNGALISWKLQSQDETLIERGLAECQLGAFEIELGDQWQDYCDQDLQLTANLGAKASSEALVEAICE